MMFGNPCIVLQSLSGVLSGQLQLERYIASYKNKHVLVHEERPYTPVVSIHEDHYGQ